MKRTKIQDDKTFILQDEIYSSSIIPFVKKELKRRVILNGDIILNGGVFCLDLDIEAKNIFIQKSVYADKGIYIKGEKNCQLWFNSPVSSGQSILIDSKSKLRVRFGKSIRSKTINLLNSIVYGNVIAEKVILKNSIILGGVFANTLEVDNSIIGTYHCKKVFQKNNLGFLYPLAISDEEPEITGNIFTVIPDVDDNISSSGLYKMGIEDFYPFYYKKKINYIFSNTLRIFDLRPFYNNLNENIIKIFNASGKGTDYSKLEHLYHEFDNKYYFYIENDFKLPEKNIHSDFMTIDKTYIDNYFNIEEKAISNEEASNKLQN